METEVFAVTLTNCAHSKGVFSCPFSSCLGMQLVITLTDEALDIYSRILSLSEYVEINLSICFICCKNAVLGLNSQALHDWMDDFIHQTEQTFACYVTVGCFTSLLLLPQIFLDTSLKINFLNFVYRDCFCFISDTFCICVQVSLLFL